MEESGLRTFLSKCADAGLEEHLWKVSTRASGLLTWRHSVSLSSQAWKVSEALSRLTQTSVFSRCHCGCSHLLSYVLGISRAGRPGSVQGSDVISGVDWLSGVFWNCNSSLGLWSVGLDASSLSLTEHPGILTFPVEQGMDLIRVGG